MGMHPELWRWTATELAKGIRTRAISAREATESCLARIAQVNPVLNALVEVTADEALTSADTADQAVAKGRELGALHGVPVSIKINSDQVGHATTHGTVSRKNNIAAQDAPHVANLRKEGAIFIGRSNSPAFGYRWFTNCIAHGSTLNPWSREHTPGGSSGGAGASVASGMVPIGHGNDIGGSIRYPAYACGITGLRPTVGRIPSWYGDENQSLSIQTMLAQGPLARSVADLRLALQAMSGFDARDPLYAPVPLRSTTTDRPIRVGIVRDGGIKQPVNEVNAAIDTAAAHLRDAGYNVEEVDAPAFAEAYRLWHLLVLEEFRPMMPAVREDGDPAMLKAAEYYYAHAETMWGSAPSLDTYMTGYARRGTLIAQLAQFMERWPLLLQPVSTELPFEQDADLASMRRMGEILEAQWPMITLPILGFPAVAVPTGIVQGLPVGVQIIGKRFREDMVLDAAEVIEARSGTFTPINPKIRSLSDRAAGSAIVV